MIKFDDDEKVQMVVRKHWIVLLLESFFLLFFVLAPILLFVLLYVIDIPLSFQPLIKGSVAVFFLSIWFLFVWIAFFTIWTDYFLDMLIVTNKRVIDIEQKGLFSRELSTFRLDRVQDVTAEVNGIIQTVFNYGTIQIQTAGEDRDFIMRGVPKPFEVKEVLSDLHDTAIEKLRTMNLSKSSLERLTELYKQDDTVHNKE